MIVTMTQTEIDHLRDICDKDMEEDAIKFLRNSLSRKYEKALRESAEYRATIRAIKAIDRGENEGIAALCDLERYER